MSQWQQLFSSGPTRLFLSDASQAFQVFPSALHLLTSLQGITIDEIVAKPSPAHSNSGEATAVASPPQLPPPVPLTVTSAPPSSKSKKIESSRKPEPPQVVQMQLTNQDQRASPSNVVLVQVPEGATPGTSVRVPGPDGNSVSLLPLLPLCPSLLFPDDDRHPSPREARGCGRGRRQIARPVDSHVHTITSGPNIGFGWLTNESPSLSSSQLNHLPPVR
jgi:hypothetical protein